MLPLSVLDLAPVNRDQTIRFGSVRYSTPPGHIDQEVWCRVEGDELVIVGRGPRGLSEVTRHQLSVPGQPRILDEHYPNHPRGGGALHHRVRPQSPTERDFLALGEGAEAWLRGAAAAGTTRVRAKMAEAVEMAALFGRPAVDQALQRAAAASRFGEEDLSSIVGHLEQVTLVGPTLCADDRFSIQPGTAAWEGFGR